MMFPQRRAAASVAAASVLGVSALAAAATQTETLSVQATQGGGSSTTSLPVPVEATAVRVRAQNANFALALSGTGASCSGTSCTLSGATRLSLRATNQAACSFFGLICVDETTSVTVDWAVPDAPPPPPPPSDDLAQRVDALEADLEALRSAAANNFSVVGGMIDDLNAAVSVLEGQSHVLATGTVRFDSSTYEVTTLNTDDTGYTVEWVAASNWTAFTFPTMEISPSDNFIVIPEDPDLHCRGNALLGQGRATCYDSSGARLTRPVSLRYTLVGRP